MAPTLFLQTDSTDPAYNLAFEEYVLTHCRQGDILILWQNANAVIIGKNQNTVQEIDPAFIREHNIQVVRRNTGGGAVYHDLGNLNYSFITDCEDISQRSAHRFTKPVVDALRNLGLNAECSGRNDILVDGKKVSGTAQQLMQGRILHHGTLLFDSDPEMIAGALHADPEKFQSKGVKSVRSRVGNIRSALPKDMTLQEFRDYLKAYLAESGVVSGTLPRQALASIQHLKESKYDTWQWNYGNSPRFDLQCSKRWPGGSVQVQLNVAAGKISQLRILGDFLGLVPISPLEQLLTGCPYREEDLRSRLEPVSVELYLGSITKQQLIQTLLNRTESS